MREGKIMNELYYGDNLDILRRYIKDESVDLIYLDPPFNSNATYNVLFSQQDGSHSRAQIHAFEDTWRWDSEAAKSYQITVEMGGPLADALRAFRLLLGNSNMMAYLSMMAPRLVELKRVLNKTGSIYLHCDPTASHYLKILMDSIFSAEFFRNEIVWQRLYGGKSDAGQFGNNSDRILFYTKSDEFYFLPPRLSHHREKTIKNWYNKEDERGRYVSRPLTAGGSTEGDSGQPWRGIEPTGHWSVPRILEQRYQKETGKSIDGSVRERLDILADAGYIDFSSTGNPSWRRYLDEANKPRVHDIWADDDVKPLGRTSAERLGYPTQKPESLLERIIGASSKEGDIILDPFCGCGTSIAAAQKMNRKWIGIDITHLAIGLIKRRMADQFGDELNYEVYGEPTTIDGAQELAEMDKYQFEWWALGLVGARPANPKKGADHGIDGRLYFHDDESGNTKQVIISVKGGSTGVSHIRDLVGVLDRENAQIGVEITLNEPTQPMRAEAASAGFYVSPWGNYPKVQILTIEELLNGAQINMPPIRQVNQTYRRAPRHKGNEGRQPNLLEK
jgi:site-specific DNA-methyltransferase (adenine-specific)